MFSKQNDEESKNQIQQILERVESLNDKLDPLGKKMLKKALNQFYFEGIPLQESFGLKNDFTEGLYSYSYNLFKVGKYEDALPLFEVLYTLNPMEIRYSFSIAACNHYLKKYTIAANKYMECILLDPTNPLLFFYLYDCFMNTEHPLSAYHAIQVALNLAKQDTKYMDLKEKIQLESEILETKLQDYLKKNF